MTFSEPTMLLPTFPNRNPVILQASLEFVHTDTKGKKAP